MLSKKERRLLEELQFNFPISSQPFQEIGKKIGLTEEETIRRIKVLQKRGVIRYIAGIFNLKNLGIKSSLIALSVPKKDLVRVIKIINGYPQVSHNYLREDKFNLWFTLSASSREELLNLIEDIKQKVRISEVLDLRTLKIFKVDSRFKV